MTQNKLKEIFDYHKDGAFIEKTHRSSKAFVGKVTKGNDCKEGYKIMRSNGKTYLMHRMIFLWHYGFLPKYIDHIDRNKKNNKIENLRPVTPSLNGANRKINKTNKSGFKGVFWCNTNKCWVASIKKNQKKTTIGYFKVKEDAAAAYKQKAIEFFGEFAVKDSSQ